MCIRDSLELVPLAFPDWLARLSDKSQIPQMFLLGDFSQFPDPGVMLVPYYMSTSIGSNRTGYSNPKVDEILDKTREVSDQGERKKLYSDLVKILQDESPWLFMIHPIEPKAFSPKVQAYDPIPDGMMRFKNVWLKA